MKMIHKIIHKMNVSSFMFSYPFFPNCMWHRRVLVIICVGFSLPKAIPIPGHLLQNGGLGQGCHVVATLWVVVGVLCVLFSYLVFQVYK